MPNFDGWNIQNDNEYYTRFFRPPDPRIRRSPSTYSDVQSTGFDINQLRQAAETVREHAAAAVARENYFSDLQNEWDTLREYESRFPRKKKRLSSVKARKVEPTGFSKFIKRTTL